MQRLAMCPVEYFKAQEKRLPSTLVLIATYPSILGVQLSPTATSNDATTETGPPRRVGTMCIGYGCIPGDLEIVLVFFLSFYFFIGFGFFLTFLRWLQEDDERHNRMKNDGGFCLLYPAICFVKAIFWPIWLVIRFTKKYLCTPGRTCFGWDCRRLLAQQKERRQKPNDGSQDDLEAALGAEPTPSSPSNASGIVSSPPPVYSAAVEMSPLGGSRNGRS